MLFSISRDRAALGPLAAVITQLQPRGMPSLRTLCNREARLSEQFNRGRLTPAALADAVHHLARQCDSVRERPAPAGETEDGMLARLSMRCTDPVRQAELTPLLSQRAREARALGHLLTLCGDATADDALIRASVARVACIAKKPCTDTTQLQREHQVLRRLRRERSAGMLERTGAVGRLINAEIAQR